MYVTVKKEELILSFWSDRGAKDKMRGGDGLEPRELHQ